MFNELNKIIKDCKEVAKQEWKREFGNKSLKEYIQDSKDYKDIQRSLNKLKGKNKNNFDL